MTHPFIAVAGIFLVGAMCGINAPGAHADVVSCYLKDNTVVAQNGEQYRGPAGIMNIDLVAQTVTMCSEEGCQAPNPVRITATRDGFELVDVTTPTAKFAAWVKGAKYNHAGIDSQGRVLVGNGICK